jgi:hypothetical protein
LAGSDDETTPPGWYRQKDDPGTLRWWDGEVWTDDLMPMPPGFGRAGRAAPAAPSGREPGSEAATPDGTDELPAAITLDPDGDWAVDAWASDDVSEPLPRPRRTAATRPTAAARPPSTPAERTALDPAPTRIRTSPSSTRPAPSHSGSSSPRRSARNGGGSSDGDRTSQVVRRRAGGVPPGATVAARALLIAVVLGAAYFGYTKIRDAAPGDARTLTAAATAVEKDGPNDRPLTKVVLTLSDLPRGWATQTFDAAADDVCQGRIPRSVITPLEIQSASFTQGSSGPFMTNVVSRFANVETAKAYMDLTAQTTDSCRSYESNGSTVRLTPLEFPVFGDDTFVAKATGTYAQGPLDGDIVYVRVGNRVASIETIAFGKTDVSKDLLEFLTRLVSRRM